MVREWVEVWAVAWEEAWAGEWDEEEGRWFLMPWISHEQCVGCGICVDKCPAGAISIRDGIAELEINSCIRCGICHDVCPSSAIRHDSELIPQEIQANLKKAEWSMAECERLLGDPHERNKCRERLIKHFTSKKRVVEETLKELHRLGQVI